MKFHFKMVPYSGDMLHNFSGGTSRNSLHSNCKVQVGIFHPYITLPGRFQSDVLSVGGSILGGVCKSFLDLFCR